MGGGGEGSGGNESDGKRWGAAEEASLACLLLTSCCAARFLTGRGPAPVCGPGLGDPCPTTMTTVRWFTVSVGKGVPSLIQKRKATQRRQKEELTEILQSLLLLLPIFKIVIVYWELL